MQDHLFDRRPGARPPRLIAGSILVTGLLLHSGAASALDGPAGRPAPHAKATSKAKARAASTSTSTARATATAQVQGAATASATGPDWRFVRPEGTAEGLVLRQVTGPASDIAWATGDLAGRPVMLSWNGIRWRRTPLPVPDDMTLADVSAAAPHDAWVVGHRPDGSAGALHWTGSRWLAVPMDRPGPSTARAVTAISPAEVWAVGSSIGFAATTATVWRWDGSAMRAVPLPAGRGGSPGGLNSELTGVDAAGPGDVWAVGSRGGRCPEPLIAHWDGAEWTAAPAPEVAGCGALTEVVALAADDVWAVGAAGPDEHPVPLAVHWDGVSWRRVPVPDVHGRFDAVAADGRGGVWAAGTTDRARPLLARRTGSSWSYSHARVPGPAGDDEARASAGVAGLATVPGTDYLWAVGWYGRAPRTDGTRYAITWTNMPRPR